MLLALFGGLAVSGLLGMIYGPVIMVLFITTIEIYGEYFSDAKRENAVPKLEETVPASNSDDSMPEPNESIQVPEKDSPIKMEEETNDENGTQDEEE